MLKSLLETAIKNLGDNPIRIYSGHENHASPLHELLEKSLKVHVKLLCNNSAAKLDLAHLFRGADNEDDL